MANPMQLGHAARADGAWRLYTFADASGQRLRALAAHLAESPDSTVRRFTLAGAEIGSVIDMRAVFLQGHRELGVEALPAMPLPRKGRFGLVDYDLWALTSQTTFTTSQRARYCAIATPLPGSHPHCSLFTDTT